MSEYVVATSPHRTTDNNLYDLFAISCHAGGLGGGHYTATVRHMTTGQWMDCNDSRVTGLNGVPGSNLGASAYILMYRRRQAGGSGGSGGSGGGSSRGGSSGGGGSGRGRRPRASGML